MQLAVGRLGSQLQNNVRNSSSWHPAALCEAPDGTHVFPWPQSDVRVKHQLPAATRFPTSCQTHIPQSQRCGMGPRRLAEVGLIHFSVRTLPLSPQALPLTSSSAAGMGCSFASPAHFLPGKGALGILWEKVTFCFSGAERE